MADKINRYTAPDGRRVEQRTTEKQDESSGHKERVVETHVEKVPLSLEERVTEKIVPIVTERRREKYKDDKLVDTIIEQVADESLHLHPPSPKVVTKADITEAVKVALSELEVNPVPKPKRNIRTPEVQAPEPKSTPEPIVVEKVVERVVEPTVPTKNWWNSDMMDLLLYIVLSGELAFITYQLVIRSIIEK